MYGDQIEMTFHDTVPLPLEQLEKGRRKAVRQKDIILAIFEQNRGSNFTPSEIYDLYPAKPILLTSVRRSISDLTHEGRLIKCQWSESRDGNYGTLNRTWKFNDSWIPPLNPKK